jgi:hypothetical protein
MHNQGKGQEEVTKYLDEQREKFVAIAKQMTGNKEDAKALADEMLGLSGEVETILKQRVVLDTLPAKREIASFADFVTKQFTGRVPDAIATSINRYIKKNYSSSIVSAYAQRYRSAQGNMFSYGGEGIYSGRYAGIHKFAEPETGWEAYISGRKGSEGRNRAILTEAAGRLGMNMGGSSVNITVNPSPGMNEVELASLVSQQITKTMNRGSIR